MRKFLVVIPARFKSKRFPVKKYIEITKHVIETYGVDHYTKQNVEWLVSSTDSLFNNDKSRQLSLSDFL